MFDDFVIIELRTGETYAGVLDECYYNGGWVVPLVSCKQLDPSGKRWVDHDMMIERNGKKIRDSMPSFFISEIKEMFVLTKKLRDTLSAEDAMQLYVDPHYRPAQGVECDWNPIGNKKHSPYCDSNLHEALALLYRQAKNPRENEGGEHLIEESFKRIRRRLLAGGARIP